MAASEPEAPPYARASNFATDRGSVSRAASRRNANGNSRTAAYRSHIEARANRG